MSATEDGVKWQSIKDFRPGIKQFVSPDHDPGTAHEDGTWRCYATDTGALFAMPKRVNAYYRDPIVDPATRLSEEFRTIGLHVAGPIYYPPEALPGVEQNNDVVLVGTEYWTAGGLQFEMARYTRNYKYTPGWTSLWTANDGGTYDANVRPKKMEFRDQRSNNAAPLKAGPSVTGFVVNGHAWMYPDDTNTTANSTRYLPGDKVMDAGGGGLVSPDSLEAHQGRFVIFPLAVSGYGTNEVYTTNECFFWTSVNDARTMDPLLAGNYFSVLAGYENPSGYGVMQSLTANELLLIKCKGGGLILRGDLQAYDAITLPYLRSTGLSMNRGCSSPLGFMYPTDGGGIWLWEGGDVSSHVTPSMEPDFWRPPATAPAYGDKAATGWGHGHTTMCSWGEWVMLPNNWVIDTDGKSLWRIDDPNDVVFHRAVSNWRGRSCYMAPSGWRHGQDPVFYEYQWTVPASSFSWLSQPISSTMERRVEVRDVALVVQGSGRVKVTVRSGEDPIGKAVWFDATDDNRPVVKRAPVAVQGSHIQFRIESENTSGGEAPSVHELRWAERQGSLLPRA